MAEEPRDIAALVEAALAAAPVHDIHTHLFPPAFGELCLRGIDELLTYHYLVAELLRLAPLSPEAFYALPKEEQAAAVWRELFVTRSPISEAARGVVTCLSSLGLDPQAPLDSHREAFAELSPEQHVDRVLELSGVETVVMTNDPFDATERPLWEAQGAYDARFRSVLRVDPLLAPEGVAAADLARVAAQGFELGPAWDARTRAGLRAFLEAWLSRMRPLYLAASLAPEWTYPSPVLDEVILPVLKAARLPLALMIGVRRGVNPRLRLAGDGLGPADLGGLARLCEAHPEQRVLCTVLRREDQHELAVLARKFPNLHVFGCWWFVNIPSLTDDITRLRLELLGHSFTPQHSDARVLDQLIYKWHETRQMLRPILTDKYERLAEAGWSVSREQLDREVADWLGGAAMRWLEAGA